MSKYWRIEDGQVCFRTPNADLRGFDYTMLVDCLNERDKKIAAIEAKLTESEEEIKIVREQNKRVLEKLDLIVRSNQDLEKQLAEKEKAHIEAMENALNDFLTLRQELNQAKTDFAIEQLEFIKGIITFPPPLETKEEIMKTFINAINDKIYELKG